MFYYYGRKKQIAKCYPKPNFNTIIEPFAGSAAYSLHNDNWKKHVILIEKDKKVFDIWDWLINKASEKDIRNLPELKVGEKSSEFLHIIHAATKMAFFFKKIKVTPFKQLIELKGVAGKRSQEMIFYRAKNGKSLDSLQFFFR